MKRLFIGAAGTGKTHQLRLAVDEWCRDRIAAGRVDDHHRILGLTFMHGSRVRMTERLKGLPDGSPPVVVETLDRFCLKLMRRFRRKLRLEGKPIHADARDGATLQEAPHAFLAPFEEIRRQVLSILGDRDVRAVIGSSYPLLVIDEAQDCTPDLWAIVERIAEESDVVCAADPFQDLQGSGAAAQLCSWFDAHGTTRELSVQQRTSNPRILETAGALRDGLRCSAGIQVVGVPSHHVAAWQIRHAVRSQPYRAGTVILSPTGASNGFVSSVLSAVAHSDKKGRQPPAPFPWEGAAKNQTEAVLDLVRDVLGGQPEVPYDRALVLSTDPRIDSKVREVMRRSARRARRRGQLVIPQDEIEFVASQVAHAQRVSSIGEEGRRRRAMTIHQAKNREFECVIVLWPYGVGGDENQRRRALYNAITRARRDARILVQGGDKRIRGDPVLSAIVGS